MPAAAASVDSAQRWRFDAIGTSWEIETEGELPDAARAEVIRRFAVLNRQRYEEEQASALAAKPRTSKGRAKAAPAGQGALVFVDAPEATTSKKAAAPAKKVSTRRTSK